METVKTHRLARLAIGWMLAAFIPTLFALFPMPALADDLEDLVAQADVVSAQISDKQAELDRAAEAYEEAVRHQANATKEKDDALLRQRQCESDIAKLQTRLEERVSDMYKDGNVTFLDLVLSAESFEDLLKTCDMLTRINESEAEMVRELRDLRDQADAEATLARQKENEAREQAELAAEIKGDAEQKIAELQAVYDGIAEDVAQILYERQLAEIAAQSMWEADYAAAYASGYYDGWSYGGYSAYSGDWTLPANSNDIVARAYAALGSNYVWGGLGGDDGGYDCSGLVSYAYTGSSTRIGTTSTFMGYDQVSDPQPGDIVVKEGHCGIYVGDGKMIHASDYGTGVVVGNVQDGMIAVRP